MFVDNKYKKWYDNIIEIAKKRKTVEGYKEKHHILPRCLGGKDNKENIIELTAREHFICHWLLIKCAENTYVKRKMQYAFGALMRNGKNNDRKLSSRQYNIIRTQISLARKGHKHTKETRIKMSQSHKGQIPWNKGKTGIVKLSDETKKRISIASKNRKPASEETRTKISQAKLGHKTGMTGKKHTEETKRKMSQNMKGTRGPQQRIDICPYCDKKTVTFRHIKFCKIKHEKIE